MTGNRVARSSEGLLLLLVLVALVAQDALRKVLGLSPWVLLVQDLAVALLYMKVSRLRGNTGFKRPVYLAGCGFSIWVLFESTTAASDASTMVLGVHTYLWYVPLVFVGAAYLSNVRASQQACTILNATGALVGLSTLFSARLGAAAPPVLRAIDQSTELRSYGASSEIYLAPGIFATGEKAADFLVLCLAASQLLPRRSDWTGRVQMGATACSFAGLLATQRRTPILVGLAVLAVSFALQRKSEVSKVAKRNRRVARPMIFALAMALMISAPAAIVASASAIASFVTDPSDAESVMRTVVLPPPQPRALEGQGAGTATQGLDHLDKDTVHLARAEGLLTKVWLELGIIGLGLFIWMLTSVLWPLVRALRRSNRVTVTWTAYVLGVVILGLKGHQTFDNPQVQIPFWLALGAAHGSIRRERAHNLRSRRSPQRLTPRSRYPAAFR